MKKERSKENRLDLNSVQKRALFKLALDIVKADKQIHLNEVSVLNDLQDSCEITDEDMTLVHYISFQQAISTLKLLDQSKRNDVIELLSSIVGADNDVDSRESRMIAAIKLSLTDDSSQWTHIVSAVGVESEVSSRQIIYLEKNIIDRDNNDRVIFDDKFDNLLITKALNEVGLQLFYLPNVVEELSSHWDSLNDNNNKLNLLRRSMEYIVPAGDKSKISNLSNILRNMNSETFYKVITSSYKIYPEILPFNSFLMVKIHDGYLLDDDSRINRCVDFLCIDMSSDQKSHILQFVNLIAKPTCLLSYEGYYKILYDYLSSESHIISSLIIDQKYNFILKDLNSHKLKFESAPQAKALYILLLKYGVSGVSQQSFDRALEYIYNSQPESNWSVSDYLLELIKLDTDWSKLIYNLIIIYDNISTKKMEKEGFLNYISTIIKYRSTLKNYINNGFSEVSHLANKEIYNIHFNNETKSYFISIDKNLVHIIEDDHSQPISLEKSALWANLL
mgnify:FL=1